MGRGLKGKAVTVIMLTLLLVYGILIMARGLYLMIKTLKLGKRK